MLVQSKRFPTGTHLCPVAAKNSRETTKDWSVSIQPPANTQPPRRGNEPWRLRGVRRAAPHLGEGDGLPKIAWIILGGVALVLVILGVFFFLRIGSPPPVPSVIPAITLIPSSPAVPALPLLPTVAVPSSTPRPTSAVTPPRATSTATPTAPKPTAAFVKYRVRPGDTLSTIAEQHRVSIRSIMLANGLRTDFISDGQELIIPLPTPHP